MKFDMGRTTLHTLATKTDGSTQELMKLLTDLLAASAPLEGTFNGEGKARFNDFKVMTDETVKLLEDSLGEINVAQVGMNNTFLETDSNMGDNAAKVHAATNFDAAKFRSGV